MVRHHASSFSRREAKKAAGQGAGKAPAFGSAVLLGEGMAVSDTPGAGTYDAKLPEKDSMPSAAFKSTAKRGGEVERAAASSGGGLTRSGVRIPAEPRERGARALGYSLLTPLPPPPRYPPRAGIALGAPWERPGRPWTNVASDTNTDASVGVSEASIVTLSPTGTTPASGLSVNGAGQLHPTWGHEAPATRQRGYKRR